MSKRAQVQPSITPSPNAIPEPDWDALRNAAPLYPQVTATFESADIPEPDTYKTEHEVRLAADLRLVIGSPLPGDNPGVVLDFKRILAIFGPHENTRSDLRLRFSKSKARSLASAILAVASEQ